MIIDAHQHFWDLSRTDYEWLRPESGVLYRNYLPEDLAGTLRDNGVTATVLVQAAASEAETLYLLQLAQAHPFIAGVVGWVDFESPDAPRRIAALVAACGTRLKGLRPMIQDMADPAWVTRPTLDATFDALVAHDLVFDALVRPIHLNALRSRLLRHPALRAAVLNLHAGKPDIAGAKFYFLGCRPSEAAGARHADLLQALGPADRGERQGFPGRTGALCRPCLRLFRPAAGALGQRLAGVERRRGIRAMAGAVRGTGKPVRSRTC